MTGCKQRWLRDDDEMHIRELFASLVVSYLKLSGNHNSKVAGIHIGTYQGGISHERMQSDLEKLDSRRLGDALINFYN